MHETGLKNTAFSLLFLHPLCHLLPGAWLLPVIQFSDINDFLYYCQLCRPWFGEAIRNF